MKKVNEKIQAKEIITEIEAGELIEIDNSIIVGELLLTNKIIKNHIVITNTIFEAKVDFSRSKFEKIVDFSGSDFKELLISESAQFLNTFTAVQIICRKNIVINGSQFYGQAIFYDSHIEGFFCSRNHKNKVTSFHDIVSFRSTIFEKRVEFHNTIFTDKVTFASTQFYSDCYFPGVKFSNIVSFNDSKFLGLLVFRAEDESDDILNLNARVDEAAIFMGYVDFIGANLNRIESNNCQFLDTVNFSMAKFKRGVNFFNCHFKKDVIFVETIIEGKTYFCSCNFDGIADFNNCKFDGIADFSKSKFYNLYNLNDKNDKANIIFTGAIFESVAIFRSCKFGSSVSFNSCLIKGNAFFSKSYFLEYQKDHQKNDLDYIDFTRSFFEGKIDFEDCILNKKFLFIDCLVRGNTSFRKALFLSEMNLIGTTIESRLNLKGTKFYGKVYFKNTHFSTIRFSDYIKPNFPGGIDLQDCQYEILQPIEYWKSFLAHIEPYNRQAFIHLEMIARNLGKDSLANEIYRQREDKYNESLSDILELFKNKIWKCLSGYGTETWRIVIFLIFWLIVGTTIFAKNQEAVVFKDLKDKKPFTIKEGLPRGDAAWLSADLILPLKLPGTLWKPSYNFIIGPFDLPCKDQPCENKKWGFRYIDFARVLNLLGWIAVPVGIANLKGLLKNDR